MYTKRQIIWQGVYIAKLVYFYTVFRLNIERNYEIHSYNTEKKTHIHMNCNETTV